MGKKLTTLVELLELSAISALTAVGLGIAYYVDATGGNDAKRGYSPGTAWKTIAKVNTSTFKPGDRILFKRAEAWTGTTLAVPASGIPGRPIIFAAYGTGVRPRIQGNAGLSYSINVSGKNFLSFAGIHVTGRVYSFYIDGHDIVVDDCDVDLATTNNVQIYGPAANVHDVVVKNSLIHGCVNGQGLHVKHDIPGGPTNILIENNIVYSNGDTADADHGIYIKYCSNVTVRRNTSYSNFASGIKLGDGCDSSIVERNRCYSNGAHGIIWISDGSDGTGNIIRNNLCYANTLNNIHLNDGSKSGFVYHNTCVNSQGRGFVVNIATGNGATGHTIKNNLVIQDIAVVPAGSTPLSNGAAAVQPPNNTFDYNDWIFVGGGGPVKVDGVVKTFVQWQAWAGSPDANGVSASPVVVTPYTDPRLQVSSPCRNAGVDVGVTDDYDGRIRPMGAAVDIGAYEFAE